jgi:type I restriction enzyme S subunit
MAKGGRNDDSGHLTLTKMLKELDMLETDSNALIQLLTERRSALISAAVTGKIDIRGWQAPASASPAPTLVPLRGIKN